MSKDKVAEDLQNYSKAKLDEVVIGNSKKEVTEEPLAKLSKFNNLRLI